MPFIDVLTSASLPPESDQHALLTRISRATSERLGKPESYVMTRLAAGASMTFGGSVEPCCFVDVRGIGTPASEQTSALSAELCQHLEAALGVSPARTFVVFTDVPRSLWGIGTRMLG
jgi:phenylpyruvate tautomerase